MTLDETIETLRWLTPSTKDEYNALQKAIKTLKKLRPLHFIPNGDTLIEETYTTIYNEVIKQLKAEFD